MVAWRVKDADEVVCENEQLEGTLKTFGNNMSGHGLTKFDCSCVSAKALAEILL